MSGLASRWATDDSLVKEAQLQDKKTHTSTTRTPRSHAATEQKKISKAETSVSGKPLISRWADADEETGSSPKSANIPQLNTPPHSRDGLESPKRRNKNNRHKTKKNINSEPENEVLPKISDAGKSLASRLGAIDILDAKHQSQRQPQNYQQQPHSHTQPLAPKRAPPKGPSAYRQRYAAAEPDSRNDWVDEEEVEGEDDELPPMTSAGQSLAARLGMFEQKKHPSNPPASNNKARQAKQTASKSAGKYLTPRQLKQQEDNEIRLKKEKEKLERKKSQDAADKEKQEKLKQEVSEMFNKLTDVHANWADIEDDDF